MYKKRLSFLEKCIKVIIFYERQAYVDQSKAGGDKKSEAYQKSLTANLP